MWARLDTWHNLLKLVEWALELDFAQAKQGSKKQFLNDTYVEQSTIVTSVGEYGLGP